MAVPEKPSPHHTTSVQFDQSKATKQISDTKAALAQLSDKNLRLRGLTHYESA